MKTENAIDRARDNGELTEKQRRFVLAYILGGSQRHAAISAGYSPRTADTQASQLLKLPQIMDILARARKAVVAMAGTTPERLLKEICSIAYSDLRQIVDENNRLRPMSEWPDDLARAVASVKVVTRRIPGTDPVEIEYVSEFKLWDKNKAHEQLGRHLEIFNDKLDVNINIGLADRIREARERVAARAQPPMIEAKPVDDV